MEVGPVLVFPKFTSVSLPVSGVILTIPEQDTFVPQARDEVTDWASYSASYYTMRTAANAVRVLIQSETLISERNQLLRELSERMESATKFRQSLGANPSNSPIEDPFLPAPPFPRTQERVVDARLALSSLLHDVAVADLKTQAAPALPVALESRLSIPVEKVNFCSALLNLDVRATQRLACEGIATQIRHDAEIFVPEIEHPACPFQRIRLNDPVLYAGHQITSTKEEFEQFLARFEDAARTYWGGLEVAQLWNQNDIDALISWGVILPEKIRGRLDNDGPDIELAEVRLSWRERVDLISKQWKEVAERISQHQKMLQSIGANFLSYFTNGWPTTAPVNAEDRGIWIAQEAAKALYGDMSFAQGLETSLSKLGPIILNYLYLEASKENELGPPVDIKVRLKTSTMAVVTYAVSELMATQFEYRIGELGGIRFQFGKQSLPKLSQRDFDILDRLEPGSLPNGRDLGVPVTFQREALRNPRALDTRTQDIEQWRMDFEDFLSPVQLKDAPLRLYRRIYEQVAQEVGLIRAGAENIAKINDLQSAVEAINGRLGVNSESDPGVTLPGDNRVIAVHVSSGEFIGSGRPVLTLREAFRVDAKVFIDIDSYSSITMPPLTVWLVSINGIAQIETKVQFAAVIGTAQTQDDKTLLVDTEIFAVINSMPTGIPNLPEFLPLSSRFLEAAYTGVTQDILDRTEFLLTSIRGKASLELLRRIN
ncbi:hypothetical protein [Undibacterium pigrum]|uniref:Uncharacterized protein n=1 Tax=Undibacterium pigrum TaxID=401470 RepID=A0A318JHZ0_9BURK|nr:hypothetical protein [Undibacterium pigrum]PXX46973.1 hypothetical protein DFR42_101549 [Undibacterium pigrum]